MSAQAKSELTNAGQALVAFDAKTPPASRTVYTGKETGVIFIEDPAGGLRRFVLVKRVYKDATYRLQSAAITQYAQWPSIPPGIPRPNPENNPDGSPAFALDGNDASGTPVYHRVGADWRTGIAVPPGTTTQDPAAGNPNWTWWTP